MSRREAKIAIVNKLGLHARAAAKLVNLAGQFEASVELERDGKGANAKSIMSVMMLAATKGTELGLVTDGADADAAMDAIVALVADRFGEPE
ncbi:MAG: HPr family phosphocarrier protein [Pseudomonadota bacterium]